MYNVVLASSQDPSEPNTAAYGSMPESSIFNLEVTGTEVASQPKADWAIVQSQRQWHPHLIGHGFPN